MNSPMTIKTIDPVIKNILPKKTVVYMASQVVSNRLLRKN